MIASSSILLDQLKNPYESPPDFDTLAKDIPQFAPFLISTGQGYTIDWKDEKSVRALTNALLERDFNLKLELPKDRLCPTVPNRLEYSLWVLKLSILTFPLTSPDPYGGMTHSRLIGLDIGTGASAIYPLLLARLIEGLKLKPEELPCIGEDGRIRFGLIGSELDQVSFESARRNVERNGLGARVNVVEADGPEVDSDDEEEEEDAEEDDEDEDEDEDEWELISEAILERALQEDEVIDFVMVNPPFYSSRAEMEKSAKQKELEPFAVCTASQNELICKGGEVKFVKKLIRESLDVGSSRVRWFTSLIGKFSSIAPLVAQLRSYRISNYHLHLLPNSGQTRRWILTWSLGNDRIPSCILPPSDPSIKKYLPQFQGIQFSRVPLPSSFPRDSSSLETLVEKNLFSNLGEAVTTRIEPSSSTSIHVSLSASKASWTRSARRAGGSTDTTTKPNPRGERKGGIGMSLYGPKLDLGGGGMNGVMGFMHNLGEDECVEEERDAMPLLEAEFKVVVDEEKGEVKIEGEWTKGFDSRMSGNGWESLWGTLRRKLKESVL